MRRPPGRMGLGGGLIRAGAGAPGAAVAPLFTQLRITANDGGTAGPYSIAQLTMHEVVGGPDVLAGSGATITATSTNSGVIGNLTDGNDGTFFATNGGTQDITVAWLVGKNIVEVGIKSRNDGGNYGQTPYSGSIRTSPDNAVYTTAWSFGALPIAFVDPVYALMKMRNPALIPNTGTNRRIWGIRVNNAGASPFEIGKLELRATVGGAQMATGGTAMAIMPFNSGFSPDRIFTGTGNQFPWAGSQPLLGLYDFLEGNEKAKPAQLMIQASGISARCLTDFDLVYCVGIGQSPVVVQNFTSPATWGASEQRTFLVT